MRRACLGHEWWQAHAVSRAEELLREIEDDAELVSPIQSS
jgi:hypothetical protein